MQWPIFVELGMWVDILPMWSVVTECAHLILHLHICSDWLITKKANILSFVWATVTKLGMWVVVGTSTTHMVSCHQMHMFNTSFAYLFWLANCKKKGKYPEVCMGYSDKTWYVDSGGQKYINVVCHHQMCIFDTSLAYLFWLVNNNKGKYSEFCMGYIDKTWYVGSGWQKYYPCGLWLLNVHI